MLKALRMALLDEVIRSRDTIDGEHFFNLKNFVSIISEVYLNIFVIRSFKNKWHI